MNKPSISSIFSELSKLDEDTFPPVEKWDPPLCENVEMRIDRSGRWFFMNSPIGRERMVNLFSRVLRLDSDGFYYLVTPVEKIRIVVEDKPFIIIDFEVLSSGEQQMINFKRLIFQVLKNLTFSSLTFYLGFQAFFLLLKYEKDYHQQKMVELLFYLSV